MTFAAPLTQIDDSLDRLRGALVVLSLLGVAGAAAIGLIVAQRSLRPVDRLRLAAEHVADTQDLGQQMEVERDDELGSMARSFNRMLAALDLSRRQQHQLVTDASHELRTPLTSLRTNVELLQRAESMDPSDRAELMDDVVFELDELTAIVTELVELATDRRDAGAAERVDLADVALAVVDRHRRRTGATVTLDVEPSFVTAVPALVERALSNLVENAVKFAGEDGAVRVRVSDGRVEVDDDGPGIAAADREHVLERFWRADDARTMPGSGLGLSIVQQIAEAHGGSVEVGESDLGGARVALVLAQVG